MRVAEDMLVNFLGYDIYCLESKVHTKVIENLRKYTKDENKEYYRSVKDTGLTLIDYLFLSNQLGYRGTTKLAKELGIAQISLRNIFDDLSLPRLTTSEIKYGLGLEWNLTTILSIHEEAGGNVSEVMRRTNYQHHSLTQKLREHGREPLPRSGARLRFDGSRQAHIGYLSYDESQRIIDDYSQLIRNYEKPIEFQEKRRLIRIIATRMNHRVETVERYVLCWERHGHINGPIFPVEQDEGEILSVFAETGNKAETARRTLRTATTVSKVLKKYNFKFH
ncbi:MAG: hypothetical protein IH934_00780 [Nanoarchaeota archaeon]|nr:hypothetical protein [Nanoarchaeota archaeon]